MEFDNIAVIGGIALIAVSSLAWFLFRSPKPFLEGPSKLKRARIIDIHEISHDTKRFRLSLGSDKTPFGLPVAKHIKIHCPNPGTGDTWNGKPQGSTEKAKNIFRSYTPMTPTSTLGHVDLVIKIYRPGTVKMPDGKEVTWENGGKMSLHLDGLKVDQYLEIEGPTGMNEYLGRGIFKKTSLFKRTEAAKCIGMMAGGTGITPMLQIMQAAMEDKGDTTEFSLLYANKTENDILCKDLLDDLVTKGNGRFKVYYTLDFPPPNWEHKTGFITDSMIQECLPAVSQDPVIVMCGPPPMIKFACEENLDKLGYSKDRIKF